MNNKILKSVFAVLLVFTLIFTGFSVFADNESGQTPNDAGTSSVSEETTPKEAILNFLEDTGFKAIFGNLLKRTISLLFILIYTFSF